MKKSVFHTIKNSFKYRGTSDRSEFVYYTVMSSLLIFFSSLIIQYFVKYAIKHPTDTVYIKCVGIAAMGQSLMIWALFIPFCALVVRRLHDMGKSGLNGLFPSCAGLCALVFGAVISGMMHSGHAYQKSLTYNEGIAFLIFLLAGAYMIASLSFRGTNFDSRKCRDQKDGDKKSGASMFGEKGFPEHIGEAIHSVDERDDGYDGSEK